ncbi:hypothetical protein OO013_13695 [Mangrovivirga sp. M17]|uniref:Lipoprotein n=1 Tax=Mangrovivirga halotolerans TaxID=2993936 RepID=A0ABT3RTG1_9BACT|nr:hypothetical protein [Mangrovivirga halotolerans]MCX2744931.1 hypothetical protein [Mangrovivirga halotolerans]
MKTKFNNKTNRVVLIFVIVIISSCDAYNGYYIQNNSNNDYYLTVDSNSDIILELNKNITTRDNQFFILKPKSKITLFNGVNDLNKSEIPFNNIIVLNSYGDTTKNLSSKDEVYNYFRQENILVIK